MRFSCRDLRDLSPHAKPIGDFGSATEVIRIVDRFAFQGFTKNSDLCNFRLLQQYPPNSGHADSAVEGPFRLIRNSQAAPRRTASSNM
jgi:hypothetical protein